MEEYFLKYQYLKIYSKLIFLKCHLFYICFEIIILIYIAFDNRKYEIIENMIFLPFISGGLNGEIISIPDIYTYEINSNKDFIIIGCDGIFDNLSNEDIIDTALFAIDNCSHERKYDIHLFSLDVYNMIIKNAMDKLNSDNLSVIVIGLDVLEK